MWLYDDKPVDESDLENYIGFVYIIENKTNNKMYIGKKLLKFKRTKKVKGRIRKVYVDSDWKKYWGSNKNLQEDVLELGPDNFERKILCFCKSKGEMNYYEAKYQFELRVLESERFYNEWIMVKVHRSHIKKLTFLADKL